MSEPQPKIWDSMDWLLVEAKAGNENAARCLHMITVLHDTITEKEKALFLARARIITLERKLGRPE